MKKKIALVEILLDEGLESYIQTKKGSLILIYGFRDNNNKVMELLIKRGANVNVARSQDKITPLHQATLYGNPNYVQLLLEYGAETSTKDKYGRIPLYIAIKGVIYQENNDTGAAFDFTKQAPIYLEIVKLLLEASSDIEIEAEIKTLEEAMLELRNHRIEEFSGFADQVDLLLEQYR